MLCSETKTFYNICLSCKPIPLNQSITQFTYDQRKELLTWRNPQMLKLNNVSNYSSPSMILPKLELIIFIKLQFQGVFLQFYWMSNISATTMQHDPASTQIWLIPEDLKHGTLPHSRTTSAPKTASTAQFNHTFHWMTAMNPCAH